MLGYLDAGSGSMIIGAVAAGAAGVSVALRSGLSKFKRKSKDAEGGTDHDIDADQVAVEDHLDA